MVLDRTRDKSKGGKNRVYAIQLEHLTKRYGKSTTIRTMLDFIHPTSGTAKLLGLDSVNDTKAIKRRVANLAEAFGEPSSGVSVWEASYS